MLPVQSPQSDYKILSDALASPNQSIPSASRAAPSSREWYSKGLLGGVLSADGDLPFFNAMSPSSGTRGATKRRKTTGGSSTSSSSRGSGDEVGIGLFGHAEKGLRDISEQGDIFSPKLLHSPGGMSALLSPPDGYRGAGAARGNVGITFKGVVFDNFDAIQTVSTSSDRSHDSMSSSSPLSPQSKKKGGADAGNERTGRGHRKRKASRKGGEAVDVSPISDQNLDLEDSRNGGLMDNLIGDMGSGQFSNNSSSSSGSSSKRKGRGGSNSRKNDNAANRAAMTDGNLHASPVHLTAAPRSVTPLAESKTHVKCNCKKSKCLKLYCDCFRVSKYCEDCNCLDCNNCMERETERSAAVSSILERNPEAFAPRIKHDAESMTKGHLSGCHCKKSACLKKYCECFSAAVACTDKCRCMDCRNSNEHIAPVSKSVSVSPPMQAQYPLHTANEASLLDDDELLELKFDVGVR